jgi:glutamate/tyrosine decarboxylase-like PLP-dependent enzyme
MWLALKLNGVARFRAALEERLLLARYFYEEIRRVPGFEVGPKPDLSIVPFRYIPQQGDVGEFNRRLTKAIQQDGRIFISSTKIGGEFSLRLAVLGMRTHLDTINLALEIIRAKAKELEENL